MSDIKINSSNLGGALQQLLMADEIMPGSDVSYQTCKTIYAYHPLGRKMVDAPISMAQSQKRHISVSNAPEARVREAFEDEWAKANADMYIAQVASIARIYGVASVVIGAREFPPDQELPPDRLSDMSIYFNVLDPLNTAGSLVLNQDPNSPDFLKYTHVAVAGKVYHRSRSVVLMNERPMYIEYTTSAFGYVGRSVYQRALFPLKSFVSTMVTDDMVARKAGLVIAKLKAPGSIIDNAMQRMAGIKRQILKEAETNNVLSIDVAETIESIDLHNVDGPGTFARSNILKNIATAADMPAKILENETMVAGFGEGTEDAKNIARYIDGIREWMNPVYAFFDEIVMRRAWNEDFYRIIQAEFPEYREVAYNDAFYRWKNSFEAVWPSLLRDPESDAKAEEVRQKALKDMFEMLLPNMDPGNKARLIEWVVDSASENKSLFPQPLVLDYEDLKNHAPQEQGAEEGMPPGAEEGEAPPGPQAPPKPPATPPTGQTGV
jgi:hypothetical protein